GEITEDEETEETEETGQHQHGGTKKRRTIRVFLRCSVAPFVMSSRSLRRLRLLGLQERGRLQAQRAAGRRPAGDEANERHRQRDATEYDGVVARHAEQHAR